MTSYCYVCDPEGLQALIEELEDALRSGAFTGLLIDDEAAVLKPGDRVYFVLPENEAPKARCIAAGNVPTNTWQNGSIEAVLDWVPPWQSPVLVSLPPRISKTAANAHVPLSMAEDQALRDGLRGALGPPAVLQVQGPLAPFAYYDIRGQALLDDLVKQGSGKVPVPAKNVATAKDALAKSRASGQTLACLFDAAGRFRYSFLVVGAIEDVRAQPDGSHAAVLKDVQKLVPPITRMGMQSFKTKKPVSVKYLHGALLIETPVELQERVSGGASTVAAPAAEATAQTSPQAAAEPLTIFHFGYWGWGNHTEMMVETFDAIEKQRGYGPPVFVDIRISRQVRAQGFNGNAFGELLGDRYRWMRELGNPNAAGGDVDRRVDRPEAAKDLLDLAIKLQPTRRRVVFFCSCETPAVCHRSDVRKLVVQEATRRKMDAVVVEWPGGVTNVDHLVLDGGAWKTACKTQNIVPLGDVLPPMNVLTLPWASVVKLVCGEEHAWIITGPARFSSGRWALPIMQLFTESDGDAEKMAREQASRNLKECWGPARSNGARPH